jgi:rhodanese-related sulfurtransferase
MMGGTHGADAGFPGIDQNLEISVESLANIQGSTTLQLIDVREREEWDEGRIPGSTLVPMSEIGERFQELDPTRPIVTVCRVGARSLYVAEALASAGFPEVRSLAGGLNAWVAAGQPIET